MNIMENMGKLRVVIIGASGQLGTDLVKTLHDDSDIHVFPLVHKDIEITDEQMVRKVLDAISPHIVINTSAYHRVDDCETHMDKAFLVNTLAQKKLADYCSQRNQTLVYISTDYVFGIDQKRKTPYEETDLPGPMNVYGLSKLTGEYFTRYICKKYFIVRSCGLFGNMGSSVKRGNFIETILKLAKEKRHLRVVDDQIVAPTYTVDLARQIHKLIKTENFGLYHASAQGACSWYEFAKEILRLTKTKAKLSPISSAEYPTPALRPSYSVLENQNLKKHDLDIIPDWRIGLKNYLIEKGYI